MHDLLERYWDDTPTTDELRAMLGLPVPLED